MNNRVYTRFAKHLSGITNRQIKIPLYLCGRMLRAWIFFLTLCLTPYLSVAQNTLSYYVDAAQKNSPLINDNHRQAEANSFEAERLKAFYTKPQVGVTANYLFAPIISSNNGKNTFQSNPDKQTFTANDKYYGYDLASTNGGLYQALFTITQPLFNGERYKVVNEQLGTVSKIYENNAKLSAHDIEKFVTDQYVLCIQDKMQLHYTEAMLSLLTNQKEILKKLIENGIYKKSDLILLNIEFQNFASQKTTFNASYRRDLLDLNILCGINDTSLVQLQIPELIINPFIENSAFIEKYRLDSLNLLTQQKFFDLKYKPQINLFANSGINTVYAPNIPNRFGFSTGISFNYIFFDGGQRKLNRNRIDVQQKAVSFYKENFISQNTVRKNKIMTELKSYDERIVISEQQMKEYEMLIDSYKKEITLGQLSIVNYITTLKSLSLLQRDYALLFAQKQSLINTFNYWNW